MADHGNTPAAWSAVGIATLGFVVAGIGLVAFVWPMFWVGLALQPVAALVGLVMSRTAQRAASQAGH